MIELKLLVLINGWTGKAISGGDYHILRVMKEWDISHDISLIIPLIAINACKDLLSTNYKIYFSSSSTKEIVSFGAITSYFSRIIKTVFIRIRDRPDVIVSSSHLLYDTLPAFFLRLRYRTKLIVYVHHIIGNNVSHRTNLLSKLSILSEKLSFNFIKNANSIIVVNEKVKESLIQIGFEQSKIFVSGNGMDYQAIEAAKPTGKIVYDACFCGRLVKAKGVYDLSDIWKLVVQKYPVATLVILGDGPEHSNLSNKIKESKLEPNIQLKGFVSEQEKYGIMHKSNSFIFPSYEEGWGIAIAEAVACGLRVISYKLGAYKPLQAYLTEIELGNKSKMAEAIKDEIRKSEKNRIAHRELIRIDSLQEWNDIARKELEVINTEEDVEGSTG